VETSMSDQLSDEFTVEPDDHARPERGSLWERIKARRPALMAKRVVIGIAVGSFLYFTVLGGILHRIDADVNFEAPNPVPGGSHAINMAEALIERETVVNRWSPNDPFFFPTVFWDNHQNFQRGMMRGLGRFVLVMETQIGRQRGSSAIDPNLLRASGLLQFPTDVWIFDFDQSFLPIQPADTQYATAARGLREYNMRVANGSAVFETRPDALSIAVEQLASELGARTAIVDQHLNRDTFIIDMISDDIFYFNKGMTYATYLIMRELGRDFEQVLRQQQLESVWENALVSLREASIQRPLIVLNSAGASSILANHLNMQGFYIKRAILQLDEIARVIRASR
jgi:hypothetical protein